MHRVVQTIGDGHNDAGCFFAKHPRSRPKMGSRENPAQERKNCERFCRLAGPQRCQCWRSLCSLVPTCVFPRWRSLLCQCRWFVSPVSHVGLPTLTVAGFLLCSLISQASFSVCGRDDHQEPQQVSQSGEEGRLPHVTDQHDCGVLTVCLAHAHTYICTCGSS